MTISLGIKSKDRCVIKIDTLRYCRHVDCTLHGYIQQEEKFYHFADPSGVQQHQNYQHFCFG